MSLSSDSSSPRAIALRHEVDRRKSLLYIDWKLNNYCNFRCSYCRPQFHEGTIKGPPIEQVLALAQEIHATRSDKTWKHYHFTGGEPTAYLHLPEVLQQLKHQGSTTSIITNGSKSIDWWKANRDLCDEIFFTFHIEMTKFRHFFKVISSVIESQALVHVNITMLPAQFEECLATANLLAKEFRDISISLKPLIKPSREIYDYTTDQKTALQTWHTISNGSKFKQRAKSQMLVDLDNGSTELLPASRLISKGLNNFHGWQCNVGVETMSINADGAIFRGNCRVGGKIGTLATGLNSITTSPITCDKSICLCAGDICTEKSRENTENTLSESKLSHTSPPIKIPLQEVIDK